MIRDFTESSKQKLERVVMRVSQGRISSFTDRIGDGLYGVMERFGLLALKDDLSNVDSYHRMIIDKNNTTLSELEEIFDAVYAVESQYHGWLDEILETCRSFNNLLGRLSAAISPGGTVDAGAEGVAALFTVPFGEYANLFETYVDWEKALENLVEGYKLRGEVTDADKDALIALFEKYNRKLAVGLDSLLGKLTGEQIRDIKYLAYSAAEPYRSIYLSELDSYALGDTAYDGTAYFTSRSNTLNVDVEEEYANPRGAFTTFFHESGHAIDYNYCDDGTYFSLTYRDGEGRSLQDVIYGDVEANVSSVIANFTSDADMQADILAYVMGAGSVSLDDLSGEEQSLLKDVQTSYSMKLYGAKNEAGSDIYGGVTNNIVHGSYGHWDDGYWYGEDGSATFSQSKELWAEYYSYCMTGNETALANLRTYFPEASTFMDGMAAAMCEGADG